jgi:hypothetical protein
MQRVILITSPFHNIGCENPLNGGNHIPSSLP